MVRVAEEILGSRTIGMRQASQALCGAVQQRLAALR